MNVTCTADICPIALNAKCVFYESSALPNTGIATNDSIQVALQKIDAFVATIGGGDVESVNGQTGVVVLTAGDVGAVAPGANISGFTNDSGYITGAIADGDYWKITGTTVTNNPIISVENDGTVEKKVEITSALTGSPTNNVKLIIGNLDDGLGGFIPTFQLQANEDATSGTLIQAADRNLFLITFSGGIANTLKISPTGSLIDKIIDYTSDVSGTYTDRSLADWGTIRGAKTFTGAQTFRAGTATAGTAPVYFQSGVALTAPADGAMEYHSSHLYFTIGSTRYQLDQQSGGLTNSAAANELMKSDGTNAVGTGIFSTTNRVLTAGANNIQINYNALSRILVASGGVLIGHDLAAPDAFNRLHVTSNQTSGIVYPLKLSMIDNSGGPNVGNGVGMVFDVNTNSTNRKEGSIIESVSTDITSGSEDFKLVFKTMSAGAAASQVMQIDNSGASIPSAAAYYLGDPDVDGTWRIIRSGDDLLMQQREAGTYNTKHTFSGA